MTNFAFQQVDVFTSRPLRGNPLAVVVGADALTGVQMAAFANWSSEHTDDKIEAIADDERG